VFSSSDGGLNWDRGTPQCHDGDRPWLAGGKPNDVFMSTDVQEPDQGSGSGHEVFQSTDGGNTCSSTGTLASGKLANGNNWTGVGKLYNTPSREKVIAPKVTRDAKHSA